MHIQSRTTPSAVATNWAAHISPTLQKVLQSRGVASADELDLGLKNLLPATELKGLSEAIAIIDQAIDSGAPILIVGDFDADGATSTALMVLVLGQMGAKVDYLVPDRFKYGYGLTPEIVAVALREFKPQLIITVDNGISSHQGVAAAQAGGAQVVITDHHLTSKAPPTAEAVVNPNQPSCPFASKALAGVGVAFYVLAALATQRSNQGKPSVKVSQYLDLVALGTVADVAALDRNNRILVNAGLQRIKAGQARPGIQALLDVAAKDKAQLSAQDLGFVIGPRINAAGRMEHMKIGIECLLANDYSPALELARTLDQLNVQRRATENEMKAEALQALQTMGTLQAATTPKRAVVMFEPTWHQGVIGIVAGRLKDTYHCPAIIFAPADSSGQTIKGSARSIDGIHIRDAIERVAEANPGLITHFGGHAMAAGLSLKVDNFAAFEAAFVAQMALCDAHLFAQTLLTDGALTPAEMSLQTVQNIGQLGPWGTAFPPPVFEGVFDIIALKPLKEKHIKLTLTHPHTGEWLDAIWFNSFRHFATVASLKQIGLVYSLEQNTYNGVRRLQLAVQHFWVP